MDLADIFQAADASEQDNSYSVCYLVKAFVVSTSSKKCVIRFFSMKPIIHYLLPLWKIDFRELRQNNIDNHNLDCEHILSILAYRF